MAKKLVAVVKLQIPAGKANPAPPVGPALGQHGVNIMDFCKNFNNRTSKEGDSIIPVEISIFADRSYTFITKTPPVSLLLKKQLFKRATRLQAEPRLAKSPWLRSKKLPNAKCLISQQLLSKRLSMWLKALPEAWVWK